MDHMLAQDEASLRWVLGPGPVAPVHASTVPTHLHGPLCNVVDTASFAADSFTVVDYAAVTSSAAVLSECARYCSYAVCASMCCRCRAMAPEEEVLKAQLDYLQVTRKHFTTVLDQTQYDLMRERKEKRLSFKVLHACQWPPLLAWSLSSFPSVHVYMSAVTCAARFVFHVVSPCKYRPCKQRYSSPCTT